MFRLRDLKNGLFQIHKKYGGAFEGSPKSIFEEAVKMGVQQLELVKAVNELDEKNADYADFNEYGKLKYVRKDG